MHIPDRMHREDCHGKIDLITGFPRIGEDDVFEKICEAPDGAGAEYRNSGNDFGAVNVDMMLLQELEGSSAYRR